MAFYDIPKEKRILLVQQINQEIFDDFTSNNVDTIEQYASSEDTYIRKIAYQAIGKIFNANRNLRGTVLHTLKQLLCSENEKIRQTVINAAGEIGKFHFERVQSFFDIGLFDEHHSVRNAVIGSVKKWETLTIGLFLHGPNNIYNTLAKKLEEKFVTESNLEAGNTHKIFY